MQGNFRVGAQGVPGPKTSCIYIIQCGGPEGPVKIGIATNPERRRQDLQSGCPYELVLIAFVRVKGDGSVVESELHCRFSPLRIRGEWFRWGDEIAECVSRMREWNANMFKEIFPGQQGMPRVLKPVTP